ncbi:MAG: carotenoid oxygenase family protein [Actinomycetota bacterium]
MTDLAEDRKLPFHLRGNYAPVSDERTDETLEVTGAIPAELDGLYLRNGANPKSGWSPHWFAGDGMIHGLRLADGQASWYRNRWVQTRALNESGARMIGDDGTVDRTIGVNNTHVIDHAGKILALVESSFPCELTPELDTVGPYDFGGRLESAMTAHPKICPVTGEMHFFGYGFFEPYLTYHRVSADGELVQSEAIDVPGPTMIHDFSITETQVIFMDLPVVFDLDLAMKGGMPYRWDDDYGARVGVMPRGATGVQPTWFDVDPCYVFHPLNSFDDGDSVVIDTARYPELWRQDSAGFKNDAVLHRWTLDLAAGSVSETSLDDRDIEFPRVPDSLVGLRNRYGYAVGSFGETNALVKYDLDGDSSAVHDFGSDRIPGEAVFVPAEGATSEDDGWLIAFVYDKGSDRSDLVVLDAGAMEGAPVASIHLPVRVPFGFHGSWIPAERLG